MRGDRVSFVRSLAAWLSDAKWGTRRILFCILGGAVVLRFWGLSAGLPYIYHTDEWFEVNRALKLGAGVFDFERVGKGGYYYLLFVLFSAYYALQRVLGNVAGTADFLLSIFRASAILTVAGQAGAPRRDGG